MTTDKIYSLEREVAVINSKLDEIGKDLRRLADWTSRHEVLHEHMIAEHEDIRREIRDTNTTSRTRVDHLERDYTAFTSRQNVINAILGFLAGTAVTIVVTLIFGNP